MHKQEFLEKLRAGLTGLPQDDIEERVSFYSEMIDDRMEDGLSEEEAVKDAGPVEEVIRQIVSATSLPVIVKEKAKSKRRLRGWEITLLALGSPVWLALLLAAAAVVLSLYAVLWALLICLWAVEAALWAGAIGGVVLGFIYLFQGYAPSGLVLIGGGIVCAGLSVFMFMLCKAASKGTIVLTKKIATGIKLLFVGKRRSK